MSTLTKLALGLMGQLRPAPAHNVYLYCASADALGLSRDQQVLLAQTVGLPA